MTKTHVSHCAQLIRARVEAVGGIVGFSGGGRCLVSVAGGKLSACINISETRFTFLPLVNTLVIDLISLSNAQDKYNKSGVFYRINESIFPDSVSPESNFPVSKGFAKLLWMREDASSERVPNLLLERMR